MVFSARIHDIIVQVMSNHERSLTTYDSVLLNKIVSQVCQVIITIQNQQPELLLEKYRNIQWQNQSNQLILHSKFIDLLSQTQSREELLKKLRLYLRLIIAPSAFDLPILSELITEIENQNYITPESNTSSNHHQIISSFIAIGITVLLLDAENLQLNINTEKFLATICNCPIQVKIAFANWSNRGKLDVELHERGYDLIHVPAGRDNADGKMIAFGSSIHERYPNAKEVFVCSSDKVMTNLCNNLQQHGLTVYQVSQHGENIKIFNHYTSEIIIHSIKPLPEIPSLEQLILQLKNLIKEEQKLTDSYWIKLSQISRLYKNKYQLNIGQIVTKYLPGKKTKDIFINYPVDFVTHQIDETSELYVTVFEHNQILDAKNINASPQQESNQSQSLSSINSKLDLETALNNILEELIQEYQTNNFDISILGIKFRQKYGKPITEQMKQLQIGGTFINFLQSCNYFKIQLKHNKWEVSKFESPQKSILLSDINSAFDLEKTLKIILAELTQESKNSYVDIGILGIKFHQKYGKPITKQMKELKISVSFLKFLQSSSSFQIQQKGNKYKVSL